MICFEIKILFKYRFGRIPVLCKICRFRSFFLVYLNYFENCWEMFTFNGYKHQGHSICSRNPPSKFVIGAFFRLICRFRSFFFCFISIILKTVGKCSLLTVISIKDIRVAVENHPHSLFGVFGHFFFVYLNYFENCWEMFTFNGYKHQGHSICSRKPPSKFVIGAFFRLVMLYKETKKKNFRNLKITQKKHTFLKIQLYIDNSYINILDNRYIKTFCETSSINNDMICRFRSFFFVYLNYFENCWEMFTFNGYKHQGHSICRRKPPSKFVIGAFFRLVMLYKETKKKNFRNL
ncbi:hypothetical protein AGLY_016393 [Aphis glycines]|uniref:Uncharacterized protein n=1 Tax=Aphis glycines TaxID=307491 RepID=A0A6G0SY06_APHGL|nr:hypothetical protein AGLY_016393 [Aphis glycines]